jgi:hypothetical protein
MRGPNAKHELRLNSAWSERAVLKIFPGADFFLRGFCGDFGRLLVGRGFALEWFA